MPSASLFVRTVIALDDGVVVGETIVAEAKLAKDAYTKTSVGIISVASSRGCALS